MKRSIHAEVNNFKDFLNLPDIYDPINIINYFNDYIKFSPNPMENNVFMKWPDDILILRKCNCIEFSIFCHYMYNNYKYMNNIIDHAVGYVFVMQSDIVKGEDYPEPYGHSFPMVENIRTGEVFIIDFGGILSNDKSMISRGMVYGPFDSYEDALNSYSGYVKTEMLGYNSYESSFQLKDKRKEFIQEYKLKLIANSIYVTPNDLKAIDKYYDKNITQLDLLLKIQKMKLFINKIFVDKSRIAGFMELPLYVFNPKKFIKYINQNTKMMVKNLKNNFQ